MRQFVYGALFLLCLMLIAVPRAQSTDAIATSLDIPITGMVSVPLANGSLDWVTLSGSLHVVTVVTAPAIGSPVKAYVNVYDFHGLGEDTGFRYNVVGAQGLAFAYPGAGNPIEEIFDFCLLREDSEMFPLLIHGSLLFRTGGALSQVTIHSIIVDGRS